MIAKGNSINVTLIFSLERYDRGRRVLHPRPRAARRRGRRPDARSRPWRASSSRASTPRPTGGSRRSAATTSSRASSRSPTPSSPTSSYKAGLLRAALGVPGVQGRHAAARAVGVDVDEEPRLPRHDVRRGADRAGHRQHDARGDDQGLPGPRRARAAPGGASSTRRASVLRRAGRGRRRLRGRHRHARARGRREIRRLRSTN